MLSADSARTSTGQCRLVSEVAAYECIFNLVQAALGAEDGDMTVVACRRTPRHLGRLRAAMNNTQAEHVVVRGAYRCASAVAWQQEDGAATASALENFSRAGRRRRSLLAACWQAVRPGSQPTAQRSEVLHAR